MLSNFRFRESVKRGLCLHKMTGTIGSHQGVNRELAEKIAESMVDSGQKYITTAKQLIEMRVPGVTKEAVAEHIALALESQAAVNGAPTYIMDSSSIFRDGIGTAVLYRIYLTRRDLQHIFSYGTGFLAAAYRDLTFDMNDVLVNTLTQIQTYYDDTEEARGERSESHKEIQTYIRNVLVTGRRRRQTNGRGFVSQNKQAAAMTMKAYPAYFKTAIHETKPPRTAALAIGVEMTEKPVIDQTTDVCMKGCAFFMAKVKRKMLLAAARGTPLTLAAASKMVAAEDRANGTYIQQDYDGNNLSEDDQTRAMTDHAFAATNVPSSALRGGALPALLQ